jgi:hypothetical protein
MQTEQMEQIRQTGLVHDGCGGRIVEVRQTEWVEAGGYVREYTWTEMRCERCGADAWDLLEEERMATDGQMGAGG